MPAPNRVTVLLADADAWRRDGLAAVLSGTDNFEIVAAVSDGESALARMRELHPDVAVVDFNLPGLSGIELLRRARLEAPGTRLIVLAGTTDSEIVNEVVSAGGDGYLLKSGPSRHIIDAISYVRDGGLYFSPQLRRDGRNTARSSADRLRRERLREEAGAGLNDRDYEIMSMMAEGIRPILDRLDEIDNRVSQMEVGDLPVPSDPRGWLGTQLADTLRETRAPGDMEARLPELIEEAVTNRFHQMAGRLQSQIEETHVRTLETFVKNIQFKLGQRVAALEQDASKQAGALNELREYSKRTEDNLSRLIAGVDRLAQELPKRLAAADAQIPLEDAVAPEPAKVTGRRNSSRRKGIARIVQVALGLTLVFGFVIWGAARFRRSRAPVTGDSRSVSAPARSAPAADSKSKMQAAGEYSDRKDYRMAEDLYKQVVQSEPGNVEALKGLASVLFREDKIDQSAAILDKIPKN